MLGAARRCGADGVRVVAVMIAAAGRLIGSLGRCGRQACGRDRKLATAMGEDLVTWAAQVRQQVASRQAGKRADQAGRQHAAGADWPCGLVRQSG